MPESDPAQSGYLRGSGFHERAAFFIRVLISLRLNVRHHARSSTCSVWSPYDGSPHAGAPKISLYNEEVVEFEKSSPQLANICPKMKFIVAASLLAVASATPFFGKRQSVTPGATSTDAFPPNGSE